VCQPAGVGLDSKRNLYVADADQTEFWSSTRRLLMAPRRTGYRARVTLPRGCAGAGRVVCGAGRNQH
jgi:hypothetical protein